MVRYRRSGPSFAATKGGFLILDFQGSTIWNHRISAKRRSANQKHMDMIWYDHEATATIHFWCSKNHRNIPKLVESTENNSPLDLGQLKEPRSERDGHHDCNHKKTQHGHVSSGQLLPSWSTQRYHMFIWRFPKNPSYHLFIIFHYKPKPSINWGTPQAKRQAALKRKPGAAPWPWRE
jgi:hypothetical protein